MNDTTSTERASDEAPTALPQKRKLPSTTLLICMAAAVIAAVGLFLPSLSPVTTSAAVPANDGAPAPAGEANIQIVGFDYSGQLIVRPGEAIQVANEDGVPHTLTATDGSFDTGVIGGAASGSFFAPGADGVVEFICTIHPSMSGELTVSS